MAGRIPLFINILKSKLCINMFFKTILSINYCFFLFLVSSYVLFDAIPGNAFQNLLLNPQLPPEAYEQVIKLYGLDKPLLKEFNFIYSKFF